MLNVEEFLEHYGVKGMKKPTPPHKLDRIYRVAAGTAALKERMQKAKKEKIKKIKAAADKKAAEAQKEDQPQDNPKDPPQDTEKQAKGLIGKHGTTRLADIG